ncbi:hypothetical protein J437_LFUL018223 [Ladona fulva]|uniref:Uncharacterized protein n=1 Tax=Ladona fulva TaxID=123851 RepID=A0A8K0KQK2_LADFU|nr:hypothetical protein J437_LFUL018223 [Ladona fulva]
MWDYNLVMMEEIMHKHSNRTSSTQVQKSSRYSSEKSKSIEIPYTNALQSPMKLHQYPSRKYKHLRGWVSPGDQKKCSEDSQPGLTPNASSAANTPLPHDEVNVSGDATSEYWCGDKIPAENVSIETLDTKAIISKDIKWIYGPDKVAFHEPVMLPLGDPLPQTRKICRMKTIGHQIRDVAQERSSSRCDNDDDLAEALALQLFDVYKKAKNLILYSPRSGGGILGYAYCNPDHKEIVLAEPLQCVVASVSPSDSDEGPHKVDEDDERDRKEDSSQSSSETTKVPLLQSALHHGKEGRYKSSFRRQRRAYERSGMGAKMIAPVLEPLLHQAPLSSSSEDEDDKPKSHSSPYPQLHSNHLSMGNPSVIGSSTFLAYDMYEIFTGSTPGMIIAVLKAVGKIPFWIERLKISLRGKAMTVAVGMYGPKLKFSIAVIQLPPRSFIVAPVKFEQVIYKCDLEYSASNIGSAEKGHR